MQKNGKRDRTEPFLRQYPRQVGNFSAIYVLTWTIRRRENCLKSSRRIDHHHLVEIADERPIC